MKRQIEIALGIGVLTLGAGLSACKQGESSSAPATSAAPTAATAAATATAATTAAEKPLDRKPGQGPFDFPVATTTAKAGDFVLAPPIEQIERALREKPESSTFIYYGAEMLEPGEGDSKIKTNVGKEVSIPNSMILPVGGADEKAKVGDIVLTEWASGSGLERAIVVGGDSDKPVVRYMDMDYDNPAGIGKKDDTLKPKRFRVLRKPGELGTTLACKDGADHKQWILVGEQGGKALVIGFAGRMKVLDRSSCVDIPLTVNVKPGDSVWGPVMSTYREAKVTKVDAKIGRVFAKYTWGGKEQETAFAFTIVTNKL